MDFTFIRNFVVEREFTSVKGSNIKLIGTASYVVRDENGWCNCGYGFKQFGVCWNCYLNKTFDMIQVNGKNVPGCYRRGTVLKMAGCKGAELQALCTDDSCVDGKEFEKIFFS